MNCRKMPTVVQALEVGVYNAFDPAAVGIVGVAVQGKTVAGPAVDHPAESQRQVALI